MDYNQDLTNASFQLSKNNNGQFDNLYSHSLTTADVIDVKDTQTIELYAVENNFTLLINSANIGTFSIDNVFESGSIGIFMETTNTSNGVNFGTLAVQTDISGNLLCESLKNEDDCWILKNLNMVAQAQMIRIIPLIFHILFHIRVKIYHLQIILIY